PIRPAFFMCMTAWILDLPLPARALIQQAVLDITRVARESKAMFYARGYAISFADCISITLKERPYSPREARNHGQQNYPKSAP
ncbi:MAG: hypothetical protein IKY83_06355, partial [Proteobacteria bacterium]|nr:hypothetical protein [Pseudomonadota bacterium]